jgi:hypothetical protein
MSGRFADLKKIPNQPARRLLALSNTRLAHPVQSPASAPVSVVLEELDAAGAWVDMLRLFSAALPAREAIWWSCLAGRDIVGTDAADPPRTLTTSEAWVRKPDDAARNAARQAAELADVDDPTQLCATAVSFCDGKLGTGDLAHLDAPPGGVAAAVFGMNLMAVAEAGEAFEAHRTLLIDRAIDIARGGNGRIAPTRPGPGTDATPEAAS